MPGGERRYRFRLAPSGGRRWRQEPARFRQAVEERADVAAKRPIRFTETSETWFGSVPMTPDKLEIRLTGYDIDSIHQSLDLPADDGTALLSGTIAADEAARGLRRAPRFVADFRTTSATYARKPAQVTIRILDAADIRFI